MSKFLVNLFMLNTKAVVNAWTFTTLPFYTIYQQPWKKLRLSKSFGVQAIKDRQGRTVYSRPCPVKVYHPLMTYQTLNEVIPHLDPKRRAVGYREVLSEEPQLDERGQPIKIDGKELKKIKLADDYQWWNVEQVLERVDALARGLQAMGVTEKSKVLIYADNSFDWFCAGLAVGRLNAITVTLLSILNDEGVVYGCNQSEAPFIITSQELLTRLNRISPQLEHITKVVYFTDKLNPSDPKAIKAVQGLREGAKCEVATLDQVYETGAKLPPIKFKFPRADDVTLIMYTSGTTGKPKGVILTHRQLTESLLNIMHMQEEMKISLVGTAYAAYLPMGHLYGYLLNLGCFFSDAALALCSPMTMTDFSPAHVPGQKGDFQLIKPQFLGGVPLVLDRILKEVIRKLESRTPVSVPIFNYLMDYKIRWLARGYDTPIVNALVCKKINSQFGGKFSIMLCGSAPLNERTQALMGAALNIKLLQAYGLTEVAVGATGMMTHDLTYGHCGVPLNTVSYYLKDWEEGGYLASENKGEIVIGGPTVANGYYKMPEETAESFKTDPDGTRWFETGDIGEVLPNGCLKIIDRKKDLVKLSNGEFVSLGKIEAGLRSNNLIENACACTDPYSNHVTAIISPNRKAMAELAERLHKPKGASFEQLCDDADIQRYFFRTITESSKGMGFAKKEIPVRITLAKEEWTQDNNLLTAAMKMKRREVNEFYRSEIKRMFEEANGQSSKTAESGRSL